MARRKNTGTSNLSRRTFVRSGILLTAGGAMLAACGETSTGSSCATAKTLTTSQKLARDGRKYSEPSKVAGQFCKNCDFFRAGNGCGTCAIDDLPAHPDGQCNSWTAKKA